MSGESRFPALVTRGGVDALLCDPCDLSREDVDRVVLELQDRVHELLDIGARDRAVSERAMLCSHWGLTKRQAALLLKLASSSGTVSHARLHLSSIDGRREAGDYLLKPGGASNASAVQVSKLRKKLKDKGITVHTAWGEGYYLDSESRAVVKGFLIDKLGGVS